MIQSTQQKIDEVKQKYATMTPSTRFACATGAANFIAEMGARSLSGLGRGIGERVFVAPREHVIVEEFSRFKEPDDTQRETEWFAVALPVDGDGDAVVIESRLR